MTCVTPCRTAYLLVAFAVASAALLIVGCQERASLEPEDNQRASSGLTAEQLLERLRAKYAELDSYADNCSLVQRGVSRTAGKQVEVPFTQLAVMFQRPNCYRLTYEEALPGSQGATRYAVACDGKRIRSSAQELPGQIHEAIAPAVVSVDNLVPEPELRQAIFQVALENLFPQLVLLLTSDPRQPVFPRTTASKLLPEAELDGVPCYRLELSEPAGQRVLWIDQERLVLLRMELPVESQRRQLDPLQEFSRYSIDLDFSEVTLDAAIDEREFAIAVPAGARLVRRFIPPLPSAPPEILGQPVGDFGFTLADGTKISPDSLRGKVCVLDFWSTTCPPCRAETPVLDQVYQKWKDSDQVEFYAVSTDPPRIETKTVQETLQSWGTAMPVARDLAHEAYDNLQVQATPTLLVLSSDGSLQMVHVGLLESGAQLEEGIHKLVDGVDLAEMIRERYAEDLKTYNQILDAATLARSLADPPAPLAPVAPQKLPEQYQLEKLWESRPDQVSQPGDVLAVCDSFGQPREILVLDGGAAVVRFDPSGELLGRLELPKPHSGADGFLRTAVDPTGKRWYLVSGVGWEQAYLFDEQWQLHPSLPHPSQANLGDAGFLTAGEPRELQVLLGYWHGQGLRAFALDGKGLWINRHLDRVLQIAPGPAAEQGAASLWCLSTRGSLLQLAVSGQSIQETAVIGRSIVQLAREAADSLSDSVVRCGLSQDAPGQYSVVKFAEDGRVEWDYSLPPGEYAGHFSRLQLVRNPEGGEFWLAAGPDGSLHLLTDSGTLVDRYDSGYALTGFAGLHLRNSGLLLLATPESATAWAVRAETGP